MKKREVVLPLIIAVSVAAGLLLGVKIGDARRSTGSKFSINLFQNNKLNTVLSLIARDYVDDISTDSLIEVALPLVLEELDPHTVYIPRSEMSAANEQLEGQFDGIGVQFNMLTDTVVILSVIPGGPSDKMGILAGDRIMTVNDSLIAGKKVPQESVVKMLRGERGSKVVLGIERPGANDLIHFTVTRGIIPLNSIDAAFMMNDHTAFIRLSKFARNTYAEFMEAMQALSAQGMTKLIFDLRENTGGYLDQAIYLTNEFLGSGQMIVYTEGAHRKRTEQYADGKGRYQEIELVVLIDENSASASEIFAGAIQDNDRGTIVGRRSFGKGLVQEQIPLPDGSAIRLTVSRYYTPTGRSIQKPYDHGKKEYYADIQNRLMHNEFFSADSIKMNDSLRYETPGGRIVYGGGGIMPDVFVPADSTRLPGFFRETATHNLIVLYALDYTDKHRADINAIASVDALRAYFRNHPRIDDDFVAYAARKGYTPKNAADLTASMKIIGPQLRAYIGRNTPLDYNGFYPFIFNLDDSFRKGMEILNPQTE